MIEVKTLSVLLNLNPKFLHKDLILTHIEELLEKKIENNCFHNLGKIIKIRKIISIGIGKIHIDTGFSKTPVTFEADIFLPKIDQVVKGIIEKYDSNGGIYVNYNNMVSIFCLNSNLNKLLNIKNENNLTSSCSDIEKEVKVKITKVNFNEQNMIVIGKILEFID
jgi:DNA-directed RNA polymerase subunit E'/Rpb7